MWKDEVEKLLVDFDGIIALAFEDLNSELEFYFSPQEVFPGASIIKIPILLKFLKEVEGGRLNPEEKVKVLEKDIVRGAGILFELHSGVELTLMDLARLMIVISDNSATNILISRLGFEKINHFMKNTGMTSSLLRRFMMFPYKEEEENLLTVKDMTVLLRNLVRGKILSPPYTSQAINILKRQQYNEKIPLYLPDTVEIAHKTGELEGVRHDAAIIYLPEKTYFLTLFTKEAGDVLISDKTIGDISKIIYEKMKEE